MEHLSVKPGPKQLNFYGQPAIFDHFVRNRHFSSKPFTDRRPIVIEVSVNGRDVAKCSGAPSFQSNLSPNYFWLFPSWGRRLSCIRKKPVSFAINCKASVFPRPQKNRIGCKNPILFCVFTSMTLILPKNPSDPKEPKPLALPSRFPGVLLAGTSC